VRQPTCPRRGTLGDRGTTPNKEDSPDFSGLSVLQARVKADRYSATLR